MVAEIKEDHRTVSAVMLCQKSQHPWADLNWSLLGLIPSLSETELQQAAEQGDVHYWSDLALQLYPLHCDAYYHNLVSQQPKVYLVCNQDEKNKPQPLLLTVDYDEAASYMETGEQVFNANLPVELCQWLEQFVLTHYQPEKPKKRRRENWHQGGQKT